MCGVCVVVLCIELLLGGHRLCAHSAMLDVGAQNAIKVQHGPEVTTFGIAIESPSKLPMQSATAPQVLQLCLSHGSAGHLMHTHVLTNTRTSTRAQWAVLPARQPTHAGAADAACHAARHDRVLGPDGVQ